MTERITILAPVHNEALVLPTLHQRLSEALASADFAWDLLLIDDGSSDDSWAVIEQLNRAYPNVSAIRLSRNFGKEAAMSAGLQHSDADAVVIIDADLQDPPELISRFVETWREGHDVVYGQRIARDGESRTKRTTAWWFYRLMSWLSHTKIPKDTGDFRLLSRRAVQALNQLPERRRFMKGLFAWIGYSQVAVPYRRDPRAAGRSSFNYRRLLSFALEGITSFSSAPLRLATYLGLLAALLAGVYAAWVIAKTIFVGEPVPGYPSLMVTILFFSGVQLIALGVIGEYLGRLFDEGKQRPLYLVDTTLQAREKTLKSPPSSPILEK